MDKKKIALLGGIALLALVLFAAVVLFGSKSDVAYQDGAEAVADDWQFEGEEGSVAHGASGSNAPRDATNDPPGSDATGSDGEGKNGSAEGVADSFGEADASGGANGFNASNGGNESGGSGSGSASGSTGGSGSGPSIWATTPTKARHA